jgi:hypothetical protein
MATRRELRFARPHAGQPQYACFDTEGTRAAIRAEHVPVEASVQSDQAAWGGEAPLAVGARNQAIQRTEQTTHELAFTRLRNERLSMRMHRDSVP